MICGIRCILEHRNVPLLNHKRKYAYDTLMKVMNDGTGEIFFLNSHGGLEKRF